MESTFGQRNLKRVQYRHNVLRALRNYSNSGKKQGPIVDTDLVNDYLPVQMLL